MQFQVLGLWVLGQYVKLALVLVGACSTACCVRSGVKRVKESGLLSKTAFPNYGKPNSGFAPKFVRERLLGTSEGPSQPHPMQKFLATKTSSNSGEELLKE